MAEISSEPRAKRQRVDKVGRFAALEKLKKLKGSKHKYEVEDEIDNVYELVDEREYAKKAKEKYGGDWIDDDGTGYAEDGRDFFEDEDYYDDEQTSSSKNQKKSNKRTRNSEKEVKGKGTIRNLFSNVVPKKNKVSIKDDELLADILGDINNDSHENPDSNEIAVQAKTARLTFRKSDAEVAKEFMSSFINNNNKQKEEKKVQTTTDDKIIDRVLTPKPVLVNKITTFDFQKTKTDTKDSSESAIEIPNTSESTTKETTGTTKVLFEENKKIVDATEKESHFADDDLDFSCLQDDENQFEEEKIAPKSNIEKPAISVPKDMDNMQNLLSNWENICQMDNFEEEVSLSNATASNGSERSLKAQENLAFWYWEAWEDSFKCPGEVFLFGRTEDGKSICVRIEKINHVLYLLPREYLLDPISKEPTKQKVTLADLYKEFDESIAVELKLEGFRSRKVTKNFAYHSIDTNNIPEVCDYMEVHYDGKKPSPNTKKKYNSIAHIFGANTTSLERFLLDRSIKGPCWLILKQFKINQAPLSWCKTDITVSEPKFVELGDDAPPPPPLSLMTIKVRTALNPKNLKNEVCMISMLMHNQFHIDRPAPQPAFNRHICGIARPSNCNWPFDLNMKIAKFKSTRVYKEESERALLNWFLAQYQQFDPDLIVAHDAQDCQLNILGERITELNLQQWSRLGRLRLSSAKNYGKQRKKFLEYYIGRMVCDVKNSAEECIRSRAYDLQTLCQNVLKIKENERMDVNEEDLWAMYETGDGVIKLITLTMQDASYILRLMCELNLMPLALQITNICGNTMTRTLQGGRSERNEYLLLHAFTEKNYIVPDKKKRDWNEQNAGVEAASDATATGGRKKPSYSGGLVLEPVRGLYDKYILLMDFNSLYPSIIQEFNICFTTVQQPYNTEDLPVLPDESMEPGILPQQLRRLVDSRREVKKLMANPDISPELQMQYHIRQMALKLTANSMYGCLGFAHSRFFAQHLAALVTHKGREILMNTKSLVQNMGYDVVYGDTDSIMVNTNIIEYDEVFQIGHNIKQIVNKSYKQLELEIDGVFSCLLLLKKKKYAAVKVSKNSKGELQKTQEYKGLDIVRRDWSQIAVMVGKIVLDEVLSEKQLDEKLDAVHEHLEKIRTQINDNSVPLAMYIITKQLSKAPTEFNNANTQPHVQVALRMNKTRNRRYKKGDMVDYVICNDGTNNPPTQRAYHLDELKTSETLKIDNAYYLAQQIHPVVTRMVDVLEGTDASRIAECLGLDPSKYRAAAQRSYQERVEEGTGVSIVKTTLQKYRECDKFKFICVTCKTENIVASAFKPAANRNYEAVLQKCTNPDCATAPYQYLISIRNQLVLTIRKYIKRFYQNWLVCDDPACNQNTRSYTHVSSDNRPLCFYCKNGTLVRQYSERNLYNQLSYFQYMFDLNQHQQKNVTLAPDVVLAYQILQETVEQILDKSAYCTISMVKLFAYFKPLSVSDEIVHTKIELPSVAVTLEDMSE